MPAPSGPYAVTFFRTDERGGEEIVNRHEISADVLTVYRSSPGVALAAAQRVQGDRPASGFRVTDAAGKEVASHRDRPR